MLRFFRPTTTPWKTFLFTSVLLLLTIWVGAQNLVTNPSFETAVGPKPQPFSLGQVANWTSISNANQLMDFFQCGNTSVFAVAQDGTNFALIPGFAHAIVNPLRRPVFPGEKLSVNCQAYIPGCPLGAYLIKYYLSNSIPTIDPPFTSPNQIFLSQRGFSTADYLDHWMLLKGLNSTSMNPVEAAQVIVPTVTNPPCGYKYLIVYIEPAPQFGNQGGEALERNTDPNPILIDDIHVESSCASTLGVTAQAADDQAGICNDVLLSTTLSGGTAKRFYWTFGDGTTLCETTGSVLHHYSAMGTYAATVLVLDSDGCTKTVPITVEVNCERCLGLKAFFTYNCSDCIPLYEGDPRTHTQTLVGYSCKYDLSPFVLPSGGGSANSWRWEFNGVVVSTLPNPTGLYLTAGGSSLPYHGTLCLIVTDDNGCEVKVCQQLTLPCNEHRPVTSAPPFEFRVDPNPSTAGQVTLNLSEIMRQQNLQLSIINLEGRVLRTVDIPAGEASPELDLSGMKNGVYIFSIRHSEGIANQKVIIQN